MVFSVKGIILAGGAGTRLYPLTLITSKQLLPVYDKPMIYYPLSTLMLAGIRDILIISTPRDLPNFQRLLGDGSNHGLHLEYAEQASPDGLAEALLIGETFLEDEPCAMILGDNLFYGNGLSALLRQARQNAESGLATILGYYVQNPSEYGVVAFDRDGRVTSLEEKPKVPKSNYCITGLYFYPAGVSQMAKKVERSERGEYEITTLNRLYLDQKRLEVSLLGRGYTWFDTGTIDNLHVAADFVRLVEQHQGIMIAALEEIAFNNGWITKDELLLASKRFGASAYGRHLDRVAADAYNY